jgi:hypothetical protein
MKCDMWLKSVIVWLFRPTIYCAPRKVSVGFGGKDIYVENRTLLGGCSVSKGVAPVSPGKEYQLSARKDVRILADLLSVVCC